MKPKFDSGCLLIILWSLKCHTYLQTEGIVEEDLKTWNNQVFFNVECQDYWRNNIGFGMWKRIEHFLKQRNYG